MQQSTDAFVAGLDPATLDDEIEAFGSPRRRGWMLRMEVSNHILSHLGEVSTLRGMKGLAGLPIELAVPLGCQTALRTEILLRGR